MCSGRDSINSLGSADATVEQVSAAHASSGRRLCCGAATCRKPIKIRSNVGKRAVRGQAAGFGSSTLPGAGPVANFSQRGGLFFPINFIPGTGPPDFQQCSFCLGLRLLPEMRATAGLHGATEPCCGPGCGTGCGLGCGKAWRPRSGWP
jgi:hypothetical protein